MASKALQSVAVTLSVGKKTYAANVTKPTTPSRHAVIVTHGAGGDMDSADLGKLAESFASHGILCLRFTCKSLQIKERVAVFNAAIDFLRAEESYAVEKVIVAGRSMGSRAALHCAIDRDKSSGLIKGVICYAYPLNNPASKSGPRVEPLLAIDLPTLFVSGTRDSMCKLDELKAQFKEMQSSPVLCELDGVDHGFKVKKGAAFNQQETQHKYCEMSTSWASQIFVNGKYEAKVGASSGSKRTADEAFGEKDRKGPQRKKQSTLTSWTSPETQK